MTSICSAQELRKSAEDAKSETPRPLAALLGSKRKPETEKARPDASCAPLKRRLHGCGALADARIVAGEHVLG